MHSLERSQRNKLVGAGLVGLVSLALAGCGYDDSPHTLKAVAVPVGSVDLGQSEAIQYAYSVSEHNFRVPDKLVKLVFCGSIDGIEFPRTIEPAGDGTSQVNCIFDPNSITTSSWDGTDDTEISKLENMGVKYFETS